MAIDNSRAYFLVAPLTLAYLILDELYVPKAPNEFIGAEIKAMDLRRPPARYA